MRANTLALSLALAAVMSRAIAAEPPAHEPRAESASFGSQLISVSLVSTNLDRSVEFYTQVLNMSQAKVVDYPTERKIRLEFSRGGAGLLLIASKDKAAEVSARKIGRINVEVTDLGAVAAKLAALGYSLKVPVGESQEFKVRFAVATDPDGNELELVQRLQ